VVFLKDWQTGRCNASDNSALEPRIIKDPGKQVAWELFATFSGIPASIGACDFSKPARSPRGAQRRVVPSEISGWDFMASSLAERFLFHMQFHSKGGCRHDMVGNRKAVRDQGRL